MAETRRYCAYMLRGWLETTEDDPNPVWRFRLRDVRTGEEWALAGVETVAEFLERAISQDAGESSSPN